MTEISAYIPCYNNADTILRSIQSIRDQTSPVQELFVIDDASTDDSVRLVEREGVPVLVNKVNRGRGYVRAKAMRQARHELVLSLDAGKVLSLDFVAQSLNQFRDPKVAAVYGRFVQGEPGNVLERWRGRHMFKSNAHLELSLSESLITAGCVLRKSYVLNAGNYDPSLRHSEDVDLGLRLTSLDHKIMFDPCLEICDITSETLPHLLERYWRWHAGKDEGLDLLAYLRQVSYSIKTMASQDIQAGDLLAAVISLISPHYQFWRSFAGQKFSLGATEK